MKKIDTVIRPSLWEEARAQLETLGVVATLREVRTFGRTPARREVYRGSAYMLDTTTELELSMLVRDEVLEATLDALEKAAGEAEIIVTNVERVVTGRQAQPAKPVSKLRPALAERPLASPAVMTTARA